jgi:hypothetical protein
MAKRHAQVFERNRTFPITIDGKRRELTVHAEGIFQGSKIVYLLDGILVGLQQYDAFPGNTSQHLELEDHDIQVRATGSEWSKDRSLELTIEGQVIPSNELMNPPRERTRSPKFRNEALMKKKKKKKKKKVLDDHRLFVVDEHLFPSLLASFPQRDFYRGTS